MSDQAQDFYVRVAPGEPEDGPMSLQEARRHCLYLTTTAKEMTAEIITYIGNRAGDPNLNPPVKEIKYVYINGNCVYAGRAAERFSKHFNT